MGKVYIHYGHLSFDSKHFIDVINNPSNLCEGRKPHSGLWGTDINSKLGWKEIILSDKEIMNKESWRLTQSFNFSLKESAKVLSINDEVSFYNLLKPYLIDFHFDTFAIPVCNYVIDWKKLAQDYDAIEALAGSNEILHTLLHGWECDSICVFHEDVLILL